MNTTTSSDGTAIAYDRFGGGPPVIMAAGAFNTRSTTEPLAQALDHVRPPDLGIGAHLPDFADQAEHIADITQS